MFSTVSFSRGREGDDGKTIGILEHISTRWLPWRDVSLEVRIRRRDRPGSEEALNDVTIMDILTGALIEPGAD